VKPALEVAAIAFAALVVGLLLIIVVGRLVRDRRKRRSAALRPRLEAAVALYLTDRAAVPPEVSSPLALRTMKAVGLDALGELRGSERERLTALLEETGVVGDTVSRLSSRHRITRRRAAETLAQIASPQTVPALAAGLTDRDRDVRIGCAHALAELGDPGHVAEVAAVLAEAAPHRTGSVEEVLLVLGTENPRYLHSIVNLTHSLELYKLVTSIAGQLRLSELTPVLRENLQSDDDELVALSIRGLGQMGDHGAFDHLLGFLENGDCAPDVRIAAAQALGRIGDTRAVPSLESALASSNWTLQQSAAYALAQLGEPGHEALLKATSEAQPAGALALAAIGP
jgi:HEAT repeat protein